MARISKEFKMNADDLYREESFTDMRVGSIKRLIPVTSDGKEDKKRKVRYIGSAQVLTPAGMLPISFEIEADSLSMAVDKFADAARKALNDTIREIEQLQREAASGIVAARPEDLSRLKGGGSQGGGLILP